MSQQYIPFVTTTDNIKGINKTEVFDNKGNIISVSGTMGTIQYEYHPNGQVMKINSNGIVTEMSYDSRGNQTQLKDPSAGIINYTYNNLGQITSQTDAKDQTIQLIYDQAGRLEIKTGPGIFENYSYHGTPEQKGLLKSISRNGVTETYYYGNFNRLDSVRIEGASKSFTTSYQYNNFGQVHRVKNPTGLTLQYEYNHLGEIIKIYDAANLSKPLWEGIAKNQQQQWTEFRLGNDLITKFGYDSDYMLNSIKTGTSAAPAVIQNLGFNFNNKGQLVSRYEGNNHESFSYDVQNRLTVSQVWGKAPLEVNYNILGNITSTSLTGNYNYNAQKPYAVETVAGVPGSSQSGTLHTYSTFTADNKIAVMDNGVFRNEFIYGPSGHRFKVDHYQNNIHRFSKIYVDNNEFVLDNAGNIIAARTFINAPTGICAVYQDSAGIKNMHYIHTDYLGSWLVITNENRHVVARYSYDAWGRPRNPHTWELMNIGIENALLNLNAMQPRFDRGYTGHEHMCGFGLINMNGRLYDPYLQRFLSPDPYVQAPFNAQNFNRYSYCFNNPLIYTDPDGEIAWFVPILIGAAIFGTGNLIAHAVRGDVNSFGNALKYFSQGALAGAVLGAAWQFAPLIPWIGQGIQTGMNIYGVVHLGGAAVSTVSGLGQGIFTGDWSALGNAGKIFLGNFYLDENRSFFGGVWQGISRHTWEFPQTGLGHTLTQLRNTFGGVDRVDYLGGATFATRENQDGRRGMSLGNFINITISDEIVGDFENRVLTDPLFMHEYGHTFDSQIFGISYLLAIGLPSIISAGTASQVYGEPFGVTTHDFRWYEMRANRHAARYFNRHFGLDWTPFEIMNPRRRR